MPRFVPSPRSRAVLCGRGRAGGGDGDAPPGAAARSGAGAAHTGGGGGGGAMKVKKSGGAGAAAARTEEELGRKALIGPDDVLGLQRVTSGAYRGWRAGGGWGSCPRWAFPGGKKNSRSSSPRRGGKEEPFPFSRGLTQGEKGNRSPLFPGDKKWGCSTAGDRVRTGMWHPGGLGTIERTRECPGLRMQPPNSGRRSVLGCSWLLSPSPIPYAPGNGMGWVSGHSMGGNS